MKNNLRNRIAMGALALGLIGGASVAAPVLTATPAQAATNVSNCYLIDAGPGYGFWKGSSYGRYAAVCKVTCPWYDWMLGCRGGDNVTMAVSNDPNYLKRVYGIR